MEEMKPKVKSTTRLYRLDNLLYLGSSGLDTEIPDPTGSIEYLLHTMDGERTVAQLQATIQQKYPNVTSEEIVQAVKQFDQAGFLENAAFGFQDLLTEYDVARWERNINFLGSFADLHTNKYELQYRLKTARVVLLGLGGLGSHLLYDLVALGVQHLRVVEFDKVELSNLNRQILYTERDIGKPKAELAAERILAFNPHLHLEVISKRLGSLEDILEVIQESDCVICVADRPKMELVRWVNEACVRQRVALLNGGLDVQRGVYYTIIPGVTGCVECWKLQVQQEDPISNALIDEKRRLQIGGENAAFVPLVTLVGGLMLSEFVRYTTQMAPLVSAGRLMEIRFASMEMRQVEQWRRLATCPVCHDVVPRTASHML